MDVATKAWKDANFGYYGGYKDGYSDGFKAAIAQLQTSLNDFDIPEPPTLDPPNQPQVNNS